MTSTVERQTITQNVRWLAGANIAVKPLWFLFVLVSTRFLGPGEFGKFMFALSFVSILAAFLEGGVDILAMRELAADPARFRVFFAHSAVVKVFAGALLVVVTLVSRWFVPMTPAASMLVMVAVVPSVLNALMVHARFVFRAFEVMQYEARSIIAEKLSIVILCGAALLLSRDAETFMWAFVLAYLMSSVATMALVARRVGLPRWSIDFRYIWGEVIVPAAPFALMNMFMVVYFRSGTLMIQWLTGSEQFVGFYNAGYRLVESFALFPSIIVAPLYASFARGAKDPAALRPMVIKGARTIGVVSLIVAVPMFLLRDDFTAVLFGEAFAPASEAIGVILLAIVPVGMTWLFGSLVGAVGRQGRLNWYILVITLLNVAGNWLIIPKFGVTGAACVTVATEGAMAAASIWVVRDYLAGGSVGRECGRLLLPAVVIGALITAAPASFPVRLVLMVLGLSGTYFALGVVTVADVKRLVTR